MAERGLRPAPAPPPDPSRPPGAGDASWWRRVSDSPATMVVMLALALGILAGGGAAAYEYSRPATYRSDAVLLIDQPAAIAISTSDSIIVKLARLKVKYVGIVGTETFQAPVAAATHLPLGAVRAGLTATNDPTNLLVGLHATMPSRSQARLLAGAAARELVVYAEQEQAAANIKPPAQVTFTIVTPATPAVQVTPDRRRAALVGVFVCVAVVIVGVLVADLLRRRHDLRRL